MRMRTPAPGPSFLASGINPLKSSLPSAPAGRLYPATRRGKAADIYHGVTVPDPYRWLEDEKNPKVTQWMDAQDSLTRNRLAGTGLQKGLLQDFARLFYRDFFSIPKRCKNGSEFVWRQRVDQERAVLYWRQGRNGKETPLLDPNAWENKDVSWTNVSPDGKWLAYAVSENGEDRCVMYLKNVDTGQDSPLDVIADARYASPSWEPDSSGFYYLFVPDDPKLTESQAIALSDVRHHRLGTPQEQDRLVIPAIKKHGNTQSLGISLSKDGRWLFKYISHGWNKTEIHVADRKKSESDFRPVFVRPGNTKARLTLYGQHVFLMTNDGAPHWRVDHMSLADFENGSTDWQSFIPESPKAILAEMDIIGGKIALTYREDLFNSIEVRDLKGKLLHKVKLPGKGCASISGDDDHAEAFVSFEALDHPPVIWSESINTGRRRVYRKREIDGFDPSRYVVEQLWYDSKDGTRVPMTIARPKDIPFDGSTPTLLYGYGGFARGLDVGFNSSILPWLASGGIYAQAHIRGGNELGSTWHEGGRLDKKQNVFDDFIAGARTLIDQGYTHPQKLAIMGGSNGGLLVGAAMTQAPELFRAVVCQVPLLDMIRYHLSKAGKTWIPEYGSSEDPDLFPVLLGYSPYHHVKEAVPYPALLLMSGDHDDRVDPMHARKFAATIQHADPNGHGALLYVQRNAGHGGGTDTKSYVQYYADMYAFLMATTGII